MGNTNWEVIKDFIITHISAVLKKAKKELQEAYDLEQEKYVH